MVLYREAMPARNRIKTYIADAYYHLYNRGVEKRTIYEDQQDYNVFLKYLATYLIQKDENKLLSTIGNPSSAPQQKSEALKLLRLNNFADSLQLLSFCLMPNHFHFLVRQKEANVIDTFMNSLCTRYTMYFNKRYKRVGSLYQGIYKAVLVETDEQLLYMSRYIHRNPTSLHIDLLSNYEYSSYPYYLGHKNAEWLMLTDTMNHFSNTGVNTYRTFVESEKHNERSLQTIGKITLDDN